MSVKRATFAEVIGIRRKAPGNAEVRHETPAEARGTHGCDPLGAALDAARRSEAVASLPTSSDGWPPDVPAVVVPASVDGPQSAELDAAVGEVREQIAADLTEHVVRRLFGVGLTVSSLQSRATDPTARRELAGVVTEVDLAIAELRSWIFGIYQGGGRTRSQEP